MATAVDDLILDDDWSQLAAFRARPEIDYARLSRYRIDRLKQQLKLHDAAMCILVNPISLRYAVDYGTYALFQSHIPTTYLFLPQGEGPLTIHGVL